MATSRIPRKIADFNGYVITTDDYLRLPSPPPANTNWGRLGLTQDDADQWHAARQEWEVLYAKYLNVNTRTKTVNDEVAEAMDIFRTFAQPLLDIMAVSRNVEQADANAFNFKIGRTEPTHPTQPISLQPVVGLVSFGGAMTRFSCKTQHDARRAALPAEADSVMIAYKISDTPPVNYADGTEMMIVSRASDIKDWGAENCGKRLFMYVRFYNTSYPQFAGPWSELASVSL